jgi:hypothetical protein
MTNEELKKYLEENNDEQIAEVLKYIEYLEKKLKLLEKMDMLMKTSYPEQTGHYFISGELGEKDDSGLPEYIQVVPAYGVDWHMLYKRGRSFGPEW